MQFFRKSATVIHFLAFWCLNSPSYIKLRAVLFRVYTVWIVLTVLLHLWSICITFEGFITFAGSAKRFARHKSLWENGSVLNQAIRKN